MQRITGAPDRVQVAGATVRQVINNLERLHPGIKELLYDAELDDITPGLAVIVDGDVSQLGLLEQVREDSEMHFLPAIGGGRDRDPGGTRRQLGESGSLAACDALHLRHSAGER